MKKRPSGKSGGTADTITAQTPRAVYERLYGSIEERASVSYEGAKCATLFQRVVRNGTWHVPTLVVDAPAVVDDAINRADPR